MASKCLVLLLVLSTSVLEGISFKLVKIAGFYQSDESQGSHAFIRGGIWHNVENNDTFTFVGYKNRVNVRNSYAIGSSICEMFDERISLLTGETSLSSINSVSSLANAYRTTYVSTSHSKEEAGITRDHSTRYFVSIKPSLVQPILDLLLHFKWSQFAYIYNDMAGMSRFYALSMMEQFKEEKYDVVLKRVSDEKDILDTMRELRKKHTNRMIIDVDVPTLEIILEQMQQLGMVTYQFHYILTNLDFIKVNLDQFRVGGMNLTGFNIIDHTNPYYQRFSIFWNNKNKKEEAGIPPEIMMTEAALVMDTIDLFNETVTDLGKVMSLLSSRITRSCSEDYTNKDAVDPIILNKLLKSQFRGLTGNIQFDEYGERTNYTLNILGLSNNGVMKVGEWRSERKDSKERFEWNQRWLAAKPAMTDIWQANSTDDCESLGGQCLDVVEIYYNSTRGIYSVSSEANKDRVYYITTVMENPFMMLKEDRTRGEGNDRFEGYCMDLLKEITQIFNFTYNISVVPNNVYGTEQKDGSWSGMVGQLLNKQADIALAPLTITASREDVIDFTKPFMSLGVSIMIKKPMSSKPEVFSFLQPLSPDIWMCVAFAFIGVSVVLFLVSRFSSQEWYSETVHTNGHRCSSPRPIDDPNALEPMVIEKRLNNFSFANSVWFSLGALMQQGGDTTPRSLAGRIVGGVWWFFTLILISSYTANLAAFLTVERMESPINSAKDLQESNIAYGILETGSTYSLFEKSEIPLYRKMFEYMISHKENFMKSNDDGIERVRQMNGQYAFLLESTYNEYESQQKPCDTMIVPERLDSKGYGIGISRATPGFEELRDKLTLAILQLREDGTLARLRKVWWFDKGKCQGSAKDNASALSLSNVAGIFYILIIGLACALVIAIIDFYWKSRKDARRDKIGLMRAMRNKVRASVTGERGFRPVPLTDTFFPTGKSPRTEKKDLLKQVNGQTDV